MADLDNEWRKVEPLYEKIRTIADIKRFSYYPIIFIEGHSHPHITGQHGYYHNKEWIQSTLRVEVGIEWIKTHATEEQLSIVIGHRLLR